MSAAVKKVAAPKKPAEHPTYKEMIEAAITALKERKGSSKVAILKYIQANYKVGDKEKTINGHVKMGLKKGVIAGWLSQPKGTGASGSFKLVKKTVEKKPKTAVVKKTSATKKTATKKSTPKKKTASKKTPKKAAAKKPVATKKPASAAKKSVKSKKPAKKPAAAAKKPAPKKVKRKTPKKKTPAKK